MKIIDDLGRTIHFNKIPEKIVSLVPSLTLTLSDLGLGDYLKGVTRFCKYPETLIASLPKIGGPKNIDLDKIAELNPDVVFAVKEENDKEQVLALAEKIPVVIFDINSFDDSLRMLRTMGEIFNIQLLVSETIQKLTSKIESFKNLGEGSKTVYLIWKKPYMAAGTETYIGSVLKMTGFKNMIPGRYPEVDEQFLQKAETILLATEPYHFKEKDKEELQALYPDKTIKIVNGEFFTWYGTYLLEGKA